MKLDPRYTRAWVALLVLALLAEFVGRADLVTWIFAAGCALELVALFRPADGDSLSEQVWVFEGAGWSRAILVGAAAVWISVRFYLISAAPIPIKATLAGGLCAFLLVHWPLQGKAG